MRFSIQLSNKREEEKQNKIKITLKRLPLALYTHD